MKFDFEDLTIVPAVISDISSRSEINLEYLPLFVAPMDTVVNSENVSKFTNAHFQVCMPRGEAVPDDLNDLVFHSFGLDEIINMLDNGSPLPKKILIDVANGHMRKLYDTSLRIKIEYPNVILMIGNIANPETFRLYSEIGVDFIRCGIGGGSACTTSANTGIHYPMASLIKECYDIARTLDTPSKIVADGGFRKYDDIIKAIALGADYVCLGGVLNKTIESCGDKYVELNDGSGQLVKTTQENAEEIFKAGGHVSTYYRGMSTKEVQSKWGRSSLKTAEGISKFNQIQYTLNGWTENFVDYLKSNMSYCGKKDLTSYKGKVQIINITENARKRFSK
jgi:IMP dehydrogenase/GMP reductase